MSAFMRKAALVVGAVALVAATAGAAAPLLAPGMAGAAGIAGVASAATLTAIGTYGGLAAGVLTAISTATAPGMSSQGSQTSFTTNPQSGLPYAMGRTRMSGLRIYANTNTRPGYTKFNDLLWFGALLSIGGAIGGIEKFTADNEIVTFDSSGNAIGDYHDYQGQKIHLGGQQTSALALSLVGGSAPGWTTSHKLSGITHAMWCLRYNKQGEMYGAGAPEPAWIGKWVKVYDPRLDSTYPGGSGSCRALVESTYVWSDNPGLHALTWALGRWQNGKRTCGIGAPVANIRVAEFVECANVCEANGWKVGGVEWTTDSKWDSFKRILQAGGAQPTQTGAMIGCLVSTPRTAIATIESRHLLDSLSIAATKSRRDRFNSVIPRYVDEDSDWSVISGTAITVSDYVTADKGQRTKEIDYPLVQVFSGDEATQPGQLAAYDIVNSREAGPINFTTGPEWIGLKTGDVILLNVPEEGLVNQPVLITRRAPDPSTGKVAFSAQTETYAKHAYALGQSTTPPAPFSLTAPDLKPPAPAAANWAAAGTVTGEGLPAIVVTGNSEMPSADAVLIDYKLPADASWTRSAILSANEPVQHVIAPLQSETAYQIRVGYRVEQIDGEFTILAAVTTGVGVISDISNTVGEQQDKLDQLEADTAAAEAAIAAAQAQIAAIEGSVTADIGALTDQVGAVTASLGALADEVGAVTSDLFSLASDVGAVTANVGDLAQQVGLVTADLTSLSDQVIAAGGDIEAIETTLGQHGASISAVQLTANNHTGQIAQLTTDLSTANSNIGVNASAISTTNSNLAQLTTRVTTAESAVIQNATAITNVTGRTASLETSVTAQGASIGSLLTATSTHTGQIAQLTTQVSAGNPNLCPGLELGMTGWTWENASFQTFNGDGWGVFAFSTTNPADGAFAFLRSPTIPIDGSQSYTAALDAAVGISGGTVNSYIQFEWLDENGETIWFTSGPAKSGGYAFDSSGANRRALTATGESPGHAVAVKIKMVVQKVSGTLQNFNVRQVKLEKGTVATAYSGEASAAQSWTAITTATTSLAQLTTRVTTAESAVVQNTTAITNVTGRTASLETSVTAQGASIGSLLSATSTHTGQIAQLTTDLSTANANIGVNASAISTTNSNLAQLTTRVTTAESAVIQNTTAITNVTGRTASLETSVTAQGASIGSLLSATSTQAGQIAQLTTQVSAGNPNLCPGLELGLTGWTWENASFQTFNGDGWGVFAFSTTNPADGAFAFLRSPAIPIDGSQSYTAALDAAVGISGGTVNSYIQFEWLDENGATIWFTSGPAKSGGYAFDSSGANRRALAATGESPGHAVAVKIKMVVQKASGTLQNFNVRQVKLEKGTVATAYSGEASAAQSWTAITTATTSLAQLTTRVTTAESAVIQNATAITNVTGRTASLETSVTAQGASIGSLLSATSTHTGQIAQLTTDLSTANANIGVNASAISTTNSNLAQLTTRVTTAESAVIQNTTAITNVTGRTASLETSVTAQGASIGSLLSATSTQAGQIAQLTTQVSAGNPNLCPGLELGLTGWTWENASFQTFNGDGWGVFAFSTTNPADGAFAFLRSPAIPIDGSQSYTAALDAAVGISGGTVNSYIQFEWLDENGATIWFTSGPAKSGGYAFDSSGANRRALAATGESPGHAVAVKIKMVVQKASGTLQNFNVRQVKLEKGTVATAYSGEASIIQSFQALSTLTTQYASLSSTVSTQGVTISTQATAISTLQSNVTSLFAKWSLELDVNGYVSGMVTNNNGTRADLTLRMDKVKMVTPSGLGGYWQVIFDGQGRPTQTIGDDSSGVTIEIGYLA